jgi:signal transduction histidine kinase
MTRKATTTTAQTELDFPPDFREMATFARRAKRLLAVTSALSNAATTTDVVAAVLDIGLGAVEAARGFICACTPSGLKMLHAVGYQSEVLSRVIGLDITDDTPLTRCLRTGQPVYLCSVEEYRATYPWAYERFGAVSATQAHAALPLIHDGTIIGGLGLSFEQPTAFGAVDRTFTILLAQATADAFARAVHFDAERESRREAELLARAREEVLAVVAHDLRNPLNLIQNTASLLADFDPPLSRRQQLLAISMRAARQMNRLVGDLLDVQRMQSGRLAMQMEECDAGQVVAQVEETTRPSADERGIHLTVKVPSESVRFRADPARLAQALGNLVTNAIKFTPREGRVTICVRNRKRAVAFSVADSGPGLPPEARPHLFEKFWQQHRDGRGVGLGLAIVKGIAEAHGGRVVVTSRVGVGSVFALVVPRGRDPHDR